MARNTRSRSKKKTLKVDFTGVESSGRLDDGRHIATVEEVELRESESGNDYLNWKLKAGTGVVYHTTSLQPQALWNLRNVLEALGVEVPDGAIDLDVEEYVGMEIGIETESELYQGKRRAVIVDIFPADESDEEEEGGEEDPEEEAGDITYEEVMEMEKDELLEIAEEEGIKVLAKQKRNLNTLRGVIAEGLGLEEPEEEEEEEPEQKTSRRTSRKKGSSTIKKGSTVTFEDDGDDVEGKVLEVNSKEGFAVVDVDGEEWEVELEDLTVA